MMTIEDIQRLEEEKNNNPKKKIFIDILRWFEIEIPVDVKAKDYVNSEECRKVCAEQILNQTTDLELEDIFLSKQNGD